MGKHFKGAGDLGDAESTAAARHSLPDEDAADEKLFSGGVPAGGFPATGDPWEDDDAGNPWEDDAGVVGFQSMATPGGAHRRTQAADAYGRLDPYDIKGRRAKTGRGPAHRAPVAQDEADLADARDPKRRRARIISTVLLIVGIVLLLAAGGMFLHDQYQYHKQDEINEKLATYAKVDDAGENPPEVDWAALKAVNPDVVGWVQIPGTVINYPVYQGDTNDTYLRTDAEGNYSVGGQIFLDAENTAPGMVDAQSIIYGHHLYNGSMFRAVAGMEEQGMLDSVETVWYVTETATYKLRPLFTYKTDGDDENVRIFSFGSDEEFRSYLQGLLAKASSKTEGAAEAVSSASNVLSLCTCSYTGNETGRVILVCAPEQSSASSDAADEGAADEAALSQDEAADQQE